MKLKPETKRCVENPNFVDKFCAEITFVGKSDMKLKLDTKRCVENPNFADKLCVEFLSSENIMQPTTAV